MSLKFMYGGFGEPYTVIETPSIKIVAEDGRTMVEITILRDGHSIEVRGASTFVSGGVLYREQFAIEPRASNSIEIRSLPYE